MDFMPGFNLVGRQAAELYLYRWIWYNIIHMRARNAGGVWNHKGGNASDIGL